MALKWKLYWLIFALTMAVYLTMVLWSLPQIAAMAGGLTPFDMRPTGYTVDQATAFLAALSSDGVSFYLNVQHLLDAAYPAMLAVVLAIGAQGLAAARAKWMGILTGIAAILGSAFDYLENGAVRAMLLAGPEGIDDQIARQASQWTVLKSACTTVAMCGVLFLLIWTLVQWWRRRQA